MRHDTAFRVMWLVSGMLAAPVAASFTGSALAQDYTYDVHGRLHTATYPSGTVVTYCYDDAGNRIRRVVSTSAVTCGPSGNTSPVAVNDTGFGFSGATFNIDALLNDSDPEGDPLTITATGPVSPAGGTATFTSSMISFTASSPDTYTFTYTISDGQGGTDTATVTVDIISF